jgi:hypothetical protein
MPGKKRLAGALAVAAAAVAISACGSSNSDQTIDPAEAQRLQSALDAVQSAINDRRCNLAQDRADDFVAAVNQLPESVGTDNKETLRAAGEHLQELAGDQSQCKPVPVTGPSGEAGFESTSTSTTTSVVPPPESTTTTTAASTPEPEDQGGGNEGGGGGPPSDTGGGPPSDTGGGPPSDTGGGPPSDTGGGGDTGGASGGTGGTGGGTGTGGTGTGGGGGTG